MARPCTARSRRRSPAVPGPVGGWLSRPSRRRSTRCAATRAAGSPYTSRRRCAVNADDRETAYRRFRDAVNMNVRQLERWLGSDESKSVGQKKSARAESTGHQSGRRIVSLLRKRKSDLTDADLSHMRKVVGYV